MIGAGSWVSSNPLSKSFDKSSTPPLGTRTLGAWPGGYSIEIVADLKSYILDVLLVGIHRIFVTHAILILPGQRLKRLRERPRTLDPPSEQATRLWRPFLSDCVSERQQREDHEKQ